MNGNKMNGMNGCGCGNQMNRPNNGCGCSNQMNRPSNGCGKQMKKKNNGSRSIYQINKQKIIIENKITKKKKIIL